MTIGLSNGQSFNDQFELAVSQLPDAPVIPEKSLNELWDDLSQAPDDDKGKSSPPKILPPDIDHPYNLNAPRGSLEAPRGMLLAGDVVPFPSVMSNPNLAKPPNPNAVLNKAIGRDNVVPIAPK